MNIWIWIAICIFVALWIGGYVIALQSVQVKQDNILKTVFWVVLLFFIWPYIAAQMGSSDI